MFSFEKRREQAGALSPEKLITKIERRRISAGAEFSEIYADYERDTEHADRLKRHYEQSFNADLGKVGEALIFSLLTDSPIGKELNFRAAHSYDDLFHGVDMIVEPRKDATPALATIDITINQDDIKGVLRKDGPITEHRPVGIELKLERIKKHIDFLADFDPGVARDLFAWIESGGLHEHHTPENTEFFKMAEKVFVLKYYKTPDDAPEPQKPGYVIGGPQTIISIDTLFINKAIQGDTAAQDVIRALSFLEFTFCIEYLKEYVQRRAKQKPEMNLFFDTYYAKAIAWSRILEQENIKNIMQGFIRTHQSNSDFRRQTEYYGKTLEKIFGK